MNFKENEKYEKENSPVNYIHPISNKQPEIEEDDYLNYEKNLQNLQKLKDETLKFEKEKDDLDSCFSNLNNILNFPSKVQNPYLEDFASFQTKNHEPESLIPDYSKMYSEPVKSEFDFKIPRESTRIPLNSLNDREDVPNYEPCRINTDIDSILGSNSIVKQDDKVVIVDYSRPPVTSTMPYNMT